MDKTLLVSVCLFGFGLGCVAATAASSFVAPPARADTDPQKWEYVCFYENVRKAGTITEKANKLGAQGWELTSSAGSGEALYNSTWCFKRPL